MLLVLALVETISGEALIQVGPWHRRTSLRPGSRQSLFAVLPISAADADQLHLKVETRLVQQPGARVECFSVARPIVI